MLIAAVEAVCGAMVGLGPPGGAREIDLDVFRASSKNSSRRPKNVFTVRKDWSWFGSFKMCSKSILSHCAMAGFIIDTKFWGGSAAGVGGLSRWQQEARYSMCT